MSGSYKCFESIKLILLLNYCRVKRNPKFYGYDFVQNEEELEKAIHELCMK